MNKCGYISDKEQQPVWTGNIILFPKSGVNKQKHQFSGTLIKCNNSFWIKTLCNSMYLSQSLYNISKVDITLCYNVNLRRKTDMYDSKFSNHPISSLIQPVQHGGGYESRARLWLAVAVETSSLTIIAPSRGPISEAARPPDVSLLSSRPIRLFYIFVLHPAGSLSLR